MGGNPRLFELKESRKMPRKEFEFDLDFRTLRVANASNSSSASLHNGQLGFEMNRRASCRETRVAIQDGYGGGNARSAQGKLASRTLLF